MSENQTATKDRVVISAKVSEESAVGWREFCEMNGVSISAMLEVVGLHFENAPFPPTDPEHLKMVEDARAIDNARRARR